MTIGTLFRYWIGNREAILTLAGDRRCLSVGFLFVISAALAREYDGKDLIHEPWHLLIPVGASLAASLLLSLLVLGLTFRQQAGIWGFWHSYLSLLSLFWMTAPLAWIYAIPFERFMTPVEAMQANLWCLAIVSAWRVLLMMRVIQVLTGCRWITALAVVMLFADTLAFVAGTLIPLPIPLFMYMGGVRITPEMQYVRSVKINLLFLGGCSLPLWIFGYLVAVGGSGGRLALAIPNTPVPAGKITGLWILAIGSLAFWLPIVPVTQREQLLKTKVEIAMVEGHIAEALAILSAHRQNEFPPHWEPPPRLNFWSEDERYYFNQEEIFQHPFDLERYGEEEGTTFDQELDFLDGVLESPKDAWFRPIYIRRLDRALSDPLLWFSLNPTRLKRMVKILEQIDEGPELARKHHDFLAAGLERVPKRLSRHRELLQAILDLGATPENGPVPP